MKGTAFTDTGSCPFEIDGPFFADGKHPQTGEYAYNDFRIGKCRDASHPIYALGSRRGLPFQRGCQAANVSNPSWNDS